MSGQMSIRIPSEKEIGVLTARILLYRLFSQLFRHPAQGPSLSRLKEMTGEALRAARVPAWVELGGALEALARELKGLDDSSRTQGYERALGHTATAKAPAYELEYGEEHSHRQPQELADISAFYRAFGLLLKPGVHERPDHVAIECEFLHVLTVKEAYAWDQGDEEHASVCREAARRFFSEHPGRWVPSFATRLIRVTDTGWVRAAAGALLAFFLKESQNLGIEASGPELDVRRIQETIETGCVSCP